LPVGGGTDERHRIFDRAQHAVSEVARRDRRRALEGRHHQELDAASCVGARDVSKVVVLAGRRRRAHRRRSRSQRAVPGRIGLGQWDQVILGVFAAFLARRIDHRGAISGTVPVSKRDDQPDAVMAGQLRPGGLHGRSSPGVTLRRRPPGGLPAWRRPWPPHERAPPRQARRSILGFWTLRLRGTNQLFPDRFESSLERRWNSRESPPPIATAPARAAIIGTPAAQPLPGRRSGPEPGNAPERSRVFRSRGAPAGR